MRGHSRGEGTHRSHHRSLASGSLRPQPPRGRHFPLQLQRWALCPELLRGQNGHLPARCNCSSIEIKTETQNRKPNGSPSHHSDFTSAFVIPCLYPDGPIFLDHLCHCNHRAHIIFCLALSFPITLEPASRDATQPAYLPCVMTS